MHNYYCFLITLASSLTIKTFNLFLFHNIDFLSLRYDLLSGLPVPFNSWFWLIISTFCLFFSHLWILFRNIVFLSQTIHIKSLYCDFLSEHFGSLSHNLDFQSQFLSHNFDFQFTIMTFNFIILPFYPKLSTLHPFKMTFSHNFAFLSNNLWLNPKI